MSSAASDVKLILTDTSLRHNIFALLRLEKLSVIK